MIDFKELGLNIQMHRKLQNLTQKDLAEKAGISFDTLKKVETGRLNFTGKMLKKIIDALDLKLTYKLERRDKNV